MSDSNYTAGELEVGRRMFAADWQFTSAASSLESLPPMAGIEIAFAGRSNVGKSSLINALTNKNDLARTSHTPGRTQELIFFHGGSSLNLVDMPGYGFAKAPREIVLSWNNLIQDFLRGRANLARVYVLVDARHGLKPPDQEVFKTLDDSAVSYQVVLTKCDQVKARDIAAYQEITARALTGRSAAFPDVLATSSREGTGMPELRAAIARLVAERDRT
jgi:GTP-binding protein